MMRPKQSLAVAAFSLAVAVQPALAEGKWDLKLDAQASVGEYVDSTQRDNTNSAGIFIAADKADKGGVTVGYNRTEVNYKQGNPTLHQDAYYLSGRVHVKPGSVPGRITLRADGHYIDNDDTTGNTDEVKVIAPQVAYLSNDKKLYLDLGYAHSDYKGDLELDQWTPTLGFAFNQLYDWLQLRAYLISSSNTARSQGQKDTQALEAKWTHYFAANGGPLSIDRLQTTALVGERMFAVDGDAGAVYNLGDVQQGSLSVGAGWDIDKSWSMLLIGGVERYKNKDINDEYDNGYVYLDVSKKW